MSEADEGRGNSSHLLYVMLYQLKLWVGSVLDLISFVFYKVFNSRKSMCSQDTVELLTITQIFLCDK